MASHSGEDATDNQQKNMMIRGSKRKLADDDFDEDSDEDSNGDCNEDCDEDSTSSGWDVSLSSEFPKCESATVFPRERPDQSKVWGEMIQLAQDVVRLDTLRSKDAPSSFRTVQFLTRARAKVTTHCRHYHSGGIHKNCPDIVDEDSYTAKLLCNASKNCKCCMGTCSVASAASSVSSASAVPAEGSDKIMDSDILESPQALQAATGTEDALSWWEDDLLTSLQHFEYSQLHLEYYPE